MSVSVDNNQVVIDEITPIELEKDAIILCFRVSGRPVPSVPSDSNRCGTCQSPIWVARDTQHEVLKNNGTKCTLCCIECFAEQTSGSQQEPIELMITPSQGELIKKKWADDENKKRGFTKGESPDSQRQSDTQGQKE